MAAFCRSGQPQVELSPSDRALRGPGGTALLTAEVLSTKAEIGALYYTPNVCVIKEIYGWTTKTIMINKGDDNF